MEIATRRDRILLGQATVVIMCISCISEFARSEREERSVPLFLKGNTDFISV